MSYLWVIAALYYCVRVHVHHRRWPLTIATYFGWPVLLLPRFRYLHFSRARRAEQESC